jgi:Uma2 family endonuclease
VAEVERMVEVGLLLEDERVELIGGELVPMSSKGIRHETLKRHLISHWIRGLPDHLTIMPETTFRLSKDTYLEPDFLVFPSELKLDAIAGGNVLLAVELADSSLGYDLYRKPAIYASFGVRELWVIDAVRLVIHLHRDPSPNGYRITQSILADEPVTPLFARELALRLADLEVD